MSSSIVDNKLETDLYCKLNGCHQFPLNKLFAVSSFQKYLENFKVRFCKRGYPQKVVDAQIKKVSQKSLDELFERPDRKETRIPLVVTYNPRLHNLSAIIRKYFTPAPFSHLFHFVLVKV